MSDDKDHHSHKTVSRAARLRGFLPFLNLALFISLGVAVVVLYSLVEWRHSNVTRNDAQPAKIRERDPPYHLNFIMTPNESTSKMTLPFKYDGTVNNYIVCCRSAKGDLVCFPTRDHFLLTLQHAEPLALIFSHIRPEFVGATCVLKVNVF